MSTSLKEFSDALEVLAARQGLDYYPVEYELVPSSFMTEIAVYGLPVRMPHWSFGVRYIYQLVQHTMGHSKLFEVVFPGNPSRAYLSNTNSLAENTLVVAHVIGHADFSKNNLLFRRSHEQVGANIVEHAAAQARQIADAIRDHGQERVETVLDAALALEHHVDIQNDVHRPAYSAEPTRHDAISKDRFLQRFEHLPDDKKEPDRPEPPQRMKIPPYPETDLLWFIAQYAPDLEGWERDIFLAVREESFYFYPIFACQIMNEGWASYWHATLLRNASFLPQDLYLDAMKAHSDVVRPYAGDKQAALAINPYHVGFVMWEKIVEEHGMERARQIMQEDDDFSFIRNHLDEDLAEELQLFTYLANKRGEVKVLKSDINELKEELLSPRFNYSAPRISVVEMASDGSLMLSHDYETDGTGLDLVRAQNVLAYIHRVWRRKVSLRTIDSKENEIVLTEGGKD